MKMINYKVWLKSPTAYLATLMIVIGIYNINSTLSSDKNAQECSRDGMTPVIIRSAVGMQVLCLDPASVRWLR